MKRWIIVIAMASSVTALAETQQQIAEQAFSKGDTAYNLGRWDEAIAHFTAAYEAWPQPELLYNIAQAYRQAANCKLALHFYKRFRSLKEADKAAPLSRRKRDEITTFIKQLTECAAKAERTIATKPDTIDPPDKPAIAPEPAPPTEPPPPPPPEPVVVAATPTNESVVEPVEVVAIPPRRDVIAARVLTGISLMSAGDLEIPLQPSLGIVAGYPLVTSLGIVELGGGLSYTPLPYEAMGASKRGSLVGVRAVASGHRRIAPRVALRVDAGIGVLALRGLAMGNPWTDGAVAGSFTLFNLRAGIAADIALTRTFALTIAPLNVAWSPGVDGLAADSIRQLEILVGIGGRR